MCKGLREKDEQRHRHCSHYVLTLSRPTCGTAAPLVLDDSCYQCVDINMH